MLRLLRALALGTTLFTVACGGGSSHATPAAIASTAAATATARLTLTIPARGILARGRTPQYISPNTTQAVVTVNSGAPQTYALSPAGPYCQSVSGGTACILTVVAPVGASDTFAIALEDANADVLSAGSFSAAITEGTANVTFPLVLGGVPKTLDFASSNTLGTFFTVGGGTQTATLTTTVKDAAGDILIGNEPFVNAAGTATPITITSANSPVIEYAVEPFGGSFGGTTETIAMNAPSDTIEMAFNGNGVPPGYDTVTYSPSSVTSATFGTNTPYLGIGIVWHAPFVPLDIAPIGADVAGSAGVPHSAVVTDGSSRLAVVGGTGSCSMPALPGAVLAVSSIAIDSGASSPDGTIYTIADTSDDTYFPDYSLSAVNSGTCTQTNDVEYSAGFAVTGIVRASGGDIIYYAADPNLPTEPPFLQQATSAAPTTLNGGPVENYGVGALTLRGTSHVFACGNDDGPDSAFLGEYEQPITGSFPAYSSFESVTGQSTNCAGLAIDGTNGQLIEANTGSTGVTHTATFPLSSEDPFNITGAVTVGSQTTDFQSVAAGNWFQARDFFINATDGIEVYNEYNPHSQQALINLTSGPFGSAITGGSVEGMMYGDDSRLWLTLSSGYVIALPTY